MTATDFDANPVTVPNVDLDAKPGCEAQGPGCQRVAAWRITIKCRCMALWCNACLEEKYRVCAEDDDYLARSIGSLVIDCTQCGAEHRMYPWASVWDQMVRSVVPL